MRPLRLALLALVLLATLPAAAVHAAPKMPVGFYDDPSFRWADGQSIIQNLKSARDAHASLVHLLADWSQIAPTKPANPLNGDDKAYNLSDLDAIVRTAPEYNLQVFITISGTPTWANGGKTPNYPPKKMSDLTQFAHMLAARYNGRRPGFGAVTRWAIWNEPNLQLFLAPSFDANGKPASPKVYANLYQAGYAGIKAGNPRAQIAIGETSNRGHNHPTGGVSNSIAPATFAHLVALANPHLKFDAWSTHPYPVLGAKLGPLQRVAYPNVAMTTISKFAASLKQWFHRRVPIWITEWAEQTAPEYGSGGISYAQQAKDVKQVLTLASQNPDVEMFVWFILRDSSSKTWYSGVIRKSGAKKPAYNIFKAEAKTIDGQTQDVNPAASSFTVKVDVPFLTWHDKPGTIVGVNWAIHLGKGTAAQGQPRSILAADQTVSFKVHFKPQRGFSYLMTVDVQDKGGQHSKRNIQLVASS